MLRGYDRRWLRGDLVAGLTVWAVLVPESPGQRDGVDGSLSKTAVNGVSGREDPALRAGRHGAEDRRDRRWPEVNGIVR